MRIKTRIEPAEAITAAIFNKLGGPGAEPTGTYLELQDDEAPLDDLKEWRTIEPCSATSRPMPSPRFRNC